MPLTDDDIKRIWGYKNATLTSRDAYDLLRRSGIQVWDDSTVTRNGEAVSVKQDLADTGTTVKALANEEDATQAQISALGAKVETLTAAVANLVTLIQASAPKAEPAKVPATQYGVDVSGHQTLEQVKAACANPKYGFAIVKATEGLSYDSPSYAAQMQAVRDAGLCAGAYHFAWPNQDPLKEAEHFARSDRERDVAQRRDASISLRDPLNLQHEAHIVASSRG